MALAFTPDQSGDSSICVALAGGWWFIGGALALTGSYSTGGEVLNLTKLVTAAGGKLRRVIVLGSSARGISLEYDKTAGKLKVFTPGDAASAAVVEHAAAAYDADVTASAIDVGFLCKVG